VDLTNITDENDRKEIDKVEQFAREEFSLKEDERKLKKLVWLGRRVVSGVLYYL
jgi:hypothetical protein